MSFLRIFLHFGFECLFTYFFLINNFRVYFTFIRRPNIYEQIFFIPVTFEIIRVSRYVI